MSTIDKHDDLYIAHHELKYFIKCFLILTVGQATAKMKVGGSEQLLYFDMELPLTVLFL